MEKKQFTIQLDPKEDFQVVPEANLRVETVGITIENDVDATATGSGEDTVLKS